MATLATTAITAMTIINSINVKPALARWMAPVRCINPSLRPLSGRSPGGLIDRRRRDSGGPGGDRCGPWGAGMGVVDGIGAGQAFRDVSPRSTESQLLLRPAGNGAA